MNRRVLLLIVGAFLPLGCGGNDAPTDPATATLMVITTSLPNAPPAVAYSETLTATGGDGTYTWSVTVGSLPTGLRLTTSTGEISGTPSMVGSNTFTVQVTSGDGQTDTQELTMTVLPVLQPSELCSDYPDGAIATFEHPNLVVRIREALGVGAGEPLTCDRVSGLTELDAFFAGISSLVGMQNLTSLRILNLGNNQALPDISALSGLTSLRTLNLFNNGISDISALSGLTSLTNLVLSANVGLSNIQPLLDNPGLGTGDTVNLGGTTVSCTDVAALQAKGVTVGSDCS